MQNAINKKNHNAILTFCAMALFYFFESIQFSYFNALAPSYLQQHLYNHQQIAALSAAYMYGIIFGLIPVGLIDRFSFRRVLLWAIGGSVIGAFLLFLSHQYSMQWIARFICGFFGGAFSFVGGMRLVALLFAKHMALFIGVFLATGTVGSIFCQYPLLFLTQHFGIDHTMAIVALFGLFVAVFNLLFLRPPALAKNQETQPLSSLAAYKVILSNRQNWLDCLMIVLLDTPVSMLGTLWGIVVLTSVFHISFASASMVMTSFFVGMLIGYPAYGIIANRFKESVNIVMISSIICLCVSSSLFIVNTLSVATLSLLFFSLGFFSSCQSVGFSWLTQNMRAELIGRNSAVNSMLFMGCNGLLKQFGAFLLSLPVFYGYSSAKNIVGFIVICMLVACVYCVFRNKLLATKKNNTKNTHASSICQKT